MNRGVQRIFSEAARTYEMINHLLTFGLDALFRRKAVSVAPKAERQQWLDVCSGTGEMAAYMHQSTKLGPRIVSSDFSIDMLREAKAKPEFNQVMRTLAESGRLPFKDASFDLVTISYATRNLNPTKSHLIGYLREIRRVMKPGGVFIHLETSQPQSLIVRRLYHLYVRWVVRFLGSLISGSKSGYAYLAYTVPRFYDAIELGRILKCAGFKGVRVATFLLGAFALHRATA